MPLNDKEQKILDEIERQFLQDDPKLAEAVRSASAPNVFRRSTQRSGIGFVSGLILMLLFFTRGGPANLGIAVIGFIIMVASASVFVVAVRRRTLGPTASAFGLNQWMDRFRSKWRR